LGGRFFISNGRYIDCLSFTCATNKSKKLKLHYKYYIEEKKHKKERRKGKKTIQSKYNSPNNKQ